MEITITEIIGIPVDKLTLFEAERLISAHRVDEVRAMLAQGLLFKEIVSRALYLPEYKTFGIYMKTVWDMTSSEAYKRIQRAELLLQIGLENEEDLKPAYLDALKKAEPADRPIIWSQVLARADEEKLTAKLVHRTVSDFYDQQQIMPAGIEGKPELPALVGRSEPVADNLPSYVFIAPTRSIGGALSVAGAVLASAPTTKKQNSSPVLAQAHRPL